MHFERVFLQARGLIKKHVKKNKKITLMWNCDIIKLFKVNKYEFQIRGLNLNPFM